MHTGHTIYRKLNMWVTYWKQMEKVWTIKSLAQQRFYVPFEVLCIPVPENK